MSAPKTLSYVLTDLMDAVKQSLAAVPEMGERVVTVSLEPGDDNPSFSHCARALADTLLQLVSQTEKPKPASSERPAKRSRVEEPPVQPNVLETLLKLLPQQQPPPQPLNPAPTAQQDPAALLQQLLRTAQPAAAQPPPQPRPLPGREPRLEPLRGENGAVLLISGLAGTMGPSELFNLFCVYGNVVRVKRLMKTKGSALVQMETYESARASIGYLNKRIVLDSQVSLTMSRHRYIDQGPRTHDPNHELPQYAVAEYTASHLNRFRGGSVPPGANQPPSEHLFFSHTSHAHANPRDFARVLYHKKAPDAADIHFAAPWRSMGPRGEIVSYRGVMSFSDVEQATIVLVRCNNVEVLLCLCLTDDNIVGPRRLTSVLRISRSV